MGVVDYLGHFVALENPEKLIGLAQEYIRKDKRKELLYYVNLIRACMNLDHHLVYKGDFFIYFMNF